MTRGTKLNPIAENSTGLSDSQEHGRRIASPMFEFLSSRVSATSCAPCRNLPTVKLLTVLFRPHGGQQWYNRQIFNSFECGNRQQALENQHQGSDYLVTDVRSNFVA